MNTRLRKMRGSAKFLVLVHTSLITKAGGAWFELIWVTFYFSDGSFGNARKPDTSSCFCVWPFFWTQLTPFRSRMFTPIEIISFSKTFLWLHYTPFAPCGQRKCHAIIKKLYIFRAYFKTAFSNLGSLLSKNLIYRERFGPSSFFEDLRLVPMTLTSRVCQQKLYGVGNRVNIFKVTRISGPDDNREFLHSGNWT